MSDGPRYVIGLTGVPSSGKGEVAAALMKLAHARDWQAAHLSFSDRIKEEARTRGVADDEFERALLSRIATEMRETEGPGVLAQRIVKKIECWPGRCPDVFVVEALRHPGEVEALRQAYGARFTLVAVASEPAIIAKRLIARQRADESQEAMASEAKAMALVELELHGGQSDQSPNVGRTMKFADVRLENNGALADLREEVARLFAEIVSADTAGFSADGFLEEV